MGKTGGIGTTEREGRESGPLQKCPQPRERERFGPNRLPGKCLSIHPGLVSAIAAESRFQLPPSSPTRRLPATLSPRRAPLRTSHTAHRWQPPSSRARPSPAPTRRTHVTGNLQTGGGCGLPITWRWAWPRWGCQDGATLE